MSSTEDELEGIDMSAWEAPEPPADLADDVLARMGGTEVGAAIPVEEPVSPRRRAWVIAGVAAAALAASVTTYMIVRSARPAGPAHGSVIAERARTLSLDGVGADLDPGAQVSWQRVDSVLHVEQRAGNAAWRVGSDEQLVIDAGATVASVEATGASLRVEVKMNAADARVLGATALTAAAVSMVTVTVYNGHVKVAGQGQPTVIVQPGATHVVTPPAPTVIPPVDEPVVGVGAPFDPARPTVADVRIRAGESPVVHSPDGTAMIEIDSVPGCRVQIDGQMRSGPIALLDDVGEYAYALVCPGNPNVDGKLTVEVTRADDPLATFAQPTPEAWVDPLRIEGQALPGAQVSIAGFELPVDADGRFATKTKTGLVTAVRVTHRLHGQHIYLFRAPALASKPVTVASAPTTLDRAAISKVMTAARPRMEECAVRSRSLGKVVIEVMVRPDGRVSSAKTKQTFDDLVGACITDVVKSLVFPKSKNTTAFTFPIDLTGCDAEKLKENGMQAINMGQHAAALELFEKSLACKPDKYVTQLAFMESCASKNQVKARLYFKQLSPDAQQKFEQICIRNGIDVSTTTATPVCDADAFKDKGVQAINKGQHAAALAQFEASLRCKNDPYVVQLAFMEACSSSNEAKARYFFKKLTKAEQDKFKPICTRQGIDPVNADADLGKLRVESKPAAKILVDGVDTGETTPALLKLKPGKHKVTFDVAGDRFTYPVTIKAGQTETMSKVLQ